MIEELQNYLCDTGIHNKDNDMIHYEKQGLIGDQLTVERCVNAKASMSNGYDAKERLDGFNFGIADWHTGMKCCSVSISL